MNNKLFEDLAFLERVRVEQKEGMALNGEVDEETLRIWKCWRGFASDPVDCAAGVSRFLANSARVRENLELGLVFSQLSKSINASWEYLTSNLTYVIYVLGIFFCVSFIYLFKVYPSVTSLLVELGAVSSMASFVGGLGLYAVALILTLGGVLIFVLFYVQRRVTRLQFLPSVFSKMPIISGFAKYYNGYVILVYSLLSTNERFEQAFENIVATRSFSKSQKNDLEMPVKKLVYADNNGFLEQEAELLIQNLTSVLNVRLLKMRSRIVLLFQLLVFIAIGFFVSGFYMPIFAIGEAI